MFGDERNLHPFTRSQSKEIHTTLEYIVKICKMLYQLVQAVLYSFVHLCQESCSHQAGAFSTAAMPKLAEAFDGKKNADKLHIHWNNHGQTIVSSHISLHSMISVNSDRRKVQQR